jgi:hypothetical protein
VRVTFPKQPGRMLAGMTRDQSGGAGAGGADAGWAADSSANRSDHLPFLRSASWRITIRSFAHLRISTDIERSAWLEDHEDVVLVDADTNPSRMVYDKPRWT